MTHDAHPDSPYGTLYGYDTGDAIRPATLAELSASVTAAQRDGGAGVIRVGPAGWTCYVLGDLDPAEMIAEHTGRKEWAE